MADKSYLHCYYYLLFTIRHRGLSCPFTFIILHALLNLHDCNSYQPIRNPITYANHHALGMEWVFKTNLFLGVIFVFVINKNIKIPLCFMSFRRLLLQIF